MNANTVSVINRENWHVSLRNLALQVNIPKTSLRHILKHHLHMRLVSSTWVPHFLTKERMEARVSACEKWLKKFEEEPDILSRTVKGNENWICHFEPLLKEESATWKSPSSPKKKERQQRSTLKVMLTSFFDCHRPTYQNFLPTNTTINSEYYCKVLQMLRYHIGRKRKDLWDR